MGVANQIPKLRIAWIKIDIKFLSDFVLPREFDGSFRGSAIHRQFEAIAAIKNLFPVIIIEFVLDDWFPINAL